MEFNEDCIVFLILIFSWIEYSWDSYLSFRQLKIYKSNKTIPEDVKEILNEESFNKARTYGIDKSLFVLCKQFVGIIITSVLLYNRWIYKAWRGCEETASIFNITPDQEILVTCFFVTFVALFSYVIYLPFTIYKTFFLEEKHGFNKQTIKFFIKDQSKSLALNLVITLPVVSVIVYIIQLGGSMFTIWLWLFSTIMSLLFLTIYPSFIAPLFDKFVPLPQGSLRTGIENLASKLDFPLSQIYIVEGSKRSAHSNAYFTGLFGVMRIVLFDTLLEKYDENKKETVGCTEAEILGVLAHELGHWKCNHINKSIVLSEFNLFLIISAFGFLFKHSLLYTTLGFPEGEQPIIIGLLVVLQMVLAPYNYLLGFFATALSRKFEFEADNFAVSLNYQNELKSSLVKLSKDNLDFPIYDRLYSVWNHSHPTLLQRIENIKNKSQELKKKE